VKTLFSFDFEGTLYRLKGNAFGKEILERNDQLVSQRRSLRMKSAHTFVCPIYGPLRLRFVMDTSSMQVRYWLETPSRLLHEGQGDYSHIMPAWLKANNQAQTEAVAGVPSNEVEAPNPKSNRSSSGHWVTLGLLALKLLKSGGAMKAVLAGTALAGWSWLFNPAVAIGLVAALLLHEWGHVLAMKHCGLKVKGIYLIPFVGGVAVSERSPARWQDFKIAIAGPAIGSLGALAGWGLWLYFDHPFWAMFAVISLLLNIFNLLPIVPLDGGLIVKSIVFSRPGMLGRGLLLGLNTLLVVGAFHFGFNLLAFFGVIGALDLIFTRTSAMARVRPMKSGGMLVAAVTYLGLIGLLGLLSVQMAATGLEGANLPLVFLKS